MDQRTGVKIKDWQPHNWQLGSSLKERDSSRNLFGITASLCSGLPSPFGSGHEPWICCREFLGVVVE
jgi:hypothetical protein